MALETLKQHRCFGGTQGVYRHDSSATRCAMEFAVYLPPQAAAHRKLPVLYWLSGLTCTWANFTEKAGAQRYAAEHGLIIVAPDTSPRGVRGPARGGFGVAERGPGRPGDGGRLPPRAAQARAPPERVPRRRHPAY